MSGSGRWRILRQDDNGNVFVVAEVETEAAARALAAEYEARGHKQTYFVESVEHGESEPHGDEG